MEITKEYALNHILASLFNDEKQNFESSFPNLISGDNTNEWIKQINNYKGEISRNPKRHTFYSWLIVNKAVAEGDKLIKARYGS